MKFLITLACVAVACADVSHLNRDYLPPQKPLNREYLPALKTFAPLSQPLASSYLAPSYSAYSPYYSPLTTFSSPLATPLRSYDAYPYTSAAFAAKAYTPLTYTSKFAAAQYNPALLNTQYQIPSAPLYNSRYYPGFDSFYHGVPQLDATYSLLDGTLPADSFVTEPKLEAKNEIVLPEPVPAPAPAPVLPAPAPTTTETPTTEPAAASFSEEDGYVYKTPSNQNQFKY